MPSYQLQIEPRQGYLVATVRGSNSAENVHGYMRDILAECHARECFRVLIDEQLDGPRLDALEVFSIASDGAMSALGIFQAIAYVDPLMGDMAEFAETVMVNRGLPVKAFANMDDAERWLMKQSHDTPEVQIFEDHNSRNRFR